MKANEAPERIWINPTIDLPKLCGPIDKDSVIYTRTDAFIEKACRAYCKVCKMPNCYSSKCDSINRFRMYMKRE